MIPYKTWARLTDALLDFRTNPCQETFDTLCRLEQSCRWPWAANEEQQEEWQSIMNRTRAEFEARVNERRTER